MDKDDMDRMDSLQDEITGLEKTIEDLEVERDNLMSDLRDSQVDSIVLQDKIDSIDSLEVENDGLQREVVELKARIDRFERGHDYPG